MRVGMYYSNKDVRVEEMPTPEIGDREILVKVRASGICGSDVMEWYRIKKAPRVLGHEITGDIVKVGKNVKKFKVGDRVFVSHHVPCNKCKYCLEGEHTICDTLRSTNFDPGGFAEYIRVPEINVDRGVFILPDEISYDEGVFIEPLACVVRGFKIADIRANKTILIVGSGIAGLLQIKLAKAWGAKKIIAVDINDYRLKKAEEFGADLALKAGEDIEKKIREFNDGWLADKVILSAGAVDAFIQALKCVEKGGTLLLFAPLKPDKEIPINIFDIWNRGIRIVSSYAGSPADIYEAIEILKNKKIEVEDMITHRLSLDEIQKGFNLVAEAKESIKVIIYP
ncbi:MAG: alcohol dehydrogenase catalytic domain-containing protein [Thermoplasmatales archaeon]|nr:alcohol dehydrogenase catalytic domain-containing protein [Thermoplasmatales archaeon]